MCGIAGYVDYSGRPIDQAILEQMATRLGHRGPDAQATWSDDRCGLVHTRLSIIDLEASIQPMHTPDGRLAIVFNGEIYNYRQLKHDLEARGHRFRTQGDTEVLLQLAAQEWSGGVDRLDAMFAFGVWDGFDQRLLLARDPLGIKPLFLARPRPDLLVFASEIKALFCHPEVSVELDGEAAVQALRFRAVYGTSTLYRGIEQLPPGHTLEWSRSGVTTSCYYDLIERSQQERERIGSLAMGQARRECLDRFDQAIEKRLIADVPVGAFLSGGLDSSMIVAQMRALHPEGDLHTFSVGFENDARSELPSARLVAEALGTTHHEVHVTLDDYIDHLGRLSQSRDAPMSEPADLAIALMSRRAREHVKVVLSGEGADEVFCGYPKYLMAETPRLLGALAGIAGPSRLASIAGLMGVDRRRVEIAMRAVALPRELDRLVSWFSYFDRMALAQLFPQLTMTSDLWERTMAAQAGVLQRASGFSRTQRMQLVDLLTWLPGNLLERGDRMTMSAGLELRVPFLDKQLAPLGVALPRREKIRGRSTKSVIRERARSMIPSEIIERKKWGFRVPLSQWFSGKLGDQIADLVASTSSFTREYGEVDRVRARIDEHRSGSNDHQLSLWTLLSLETWHREVFRTREAQIRPPRIEPRIKAPA